MTYSQGLVSIGVPTYNRPLKLRCALESLLGQTYKNIELIISDNSSTTYETECIAREFAGRDSRVRYIRQQMNIGAFSNFSYLLKQSTGDYFMWAADDDKWEPWFIEKCVSTLIRYPDVAAAMTEVQYFGVDGLYPFFPEGKAFYRNSTRSKISMLKYVLDNNYGNLIYSVFRYSSLMVEGRFFWEEAGNLSSNEIPALLYAALRGGFVVLPEVGFYKEVPVSVYKQAKWEMVGGRMPLECRITGLNSACETWTYHQKAFKDIHSAIWRLPTEEWISHKVSRMAWWNLFKHFFWMLIGWKPLSRRGSLSG